MMNINKLANWAQIAEIIAAPLRLAIVKRR
jgi:hypothetical protein